MYNSAHTGVAKAYGISSYILNLVRKKQKIGDNRLDILVDFTQKITQTRGMINTNDLIIFYNVGFSPENVMEIILAISLKTMSNYINHITKNSLNEELQPFAVGNNI